MVDPPTSKIDLANLREVVRGLETGWPIAALHVQAAIGEICRLRSESEHLQALLAQAEARWQYERDKPAGGADETTEQPAGAGCPRCGEQH